MDNTGLPMRCMYLGKDGLLALLLSEGQFLYSVIFWSAVYAIYMYITHNLKSEKFEHLNLIREDVKAIKRKESHL